MPRHSFADCRPIVCTKHTQFVQHGHMLFCKTCEPEEMSPTNDALHFHLTSINSELSGSITTRPFVLMFEAKDDLQNNIRNEFYIPKLVKLEVLHVQMA